MVRMFATLLTMIASSVAAAEKPVVAVVNYPLAYFAERLGGDAVEVLFPVSAGRDPAFWRPSLTEIAAIQQATVIAVNGANYAAWTTKVSLPRSRLVDTSAPFKSDYIQTKTITHSHGADGEHSHEGVASYTWMDFSLAARQAETLAVAMKRRMPDLAEQIDAALPALLADLKSLDVAAQKAGSALGDAAIIATHPRYQYFARAYRLDIHAMEWEVGEAPSDAQWDELKTLVEETNAKILIWEAPPPDAARDKVIALGLQDVVLHPLAHRPGEHDFLSVLRKDLERLAALAEKT